MNGNKIAAIILLVLIQGCTSSYVEVAHMSSIPSGQNGIYPHSKETDFNSIVLGARKEYKNGYYIDASIHKIVGEKELDGHNPFFMGRVGKVIWKSNKR